MVRYWYFIDEPADELSALTPIYNVKVGCSIAEQKLLQKFSFIVNADKKRFFFHIRDLKTTEFICRLLEEGFHPVITISLRDIMRKIK